MKIQTGIFPIVLSFTLLSCVEAPPVEQEKVKTAPTQVTIVDDNAGSADVGDLLTGTFDYVYAEGDSSENVRSLYRWLRNGNPIADATAATYQLTQQDNGQAVTFEVTPVLTSGAVSEAAALSPELIVNAVPSAIGVQIADNNGGAVAVGDQLTGTYIYTDAESNPEDSEQSALAWFRNDERISGATSSQYTLVPADADQTITFSVTPVATEGSIQGLPVVSNGLTVNALIVENTAPIASDVAIIDNNGGTAANSDVLTASYMYTDANGDLENTATTQFQWHRNGSVLVGTASSYTITEDDLGQSITVSVAPTALTGVISGSSVTSNPILVDDATPNTAPMVTNVTVTDTDSGTTIVGHTLATGYLYSDQEDDAEDTTETAIQWLRNGIAIESATNQQYTLTVADSGQYISVRITPAAETGVLVGTSVTAELGVNVANSAPTASNLVITPDMNIAVGMELIASYDYADLDNDAEDKEKTVVQWYRGDTAISGATFDGNTTASYTLTVDDSEQDISFRVTPASAVTFGETVESPTVHVDNSAPTATAVSIVVQGDYSPEVNRQLRATYNYSDLDNDLQDTSNTTQQWLRNGTPIAGANNYYYNLANADAGYDITYQITPVAASGVLTGSTYTSNAINVLNEAPVAVDDEGATAQNTTLLVDVLANDNEPENQDLTLSISTTGEHGIASIVDGKVQYVPEEDFFGTDTVIYQIEDPFGETSTAVLTIYVRPVVVSLADVLSNNELKASFVTTIDGTATFPIGADDIVAGQFNDDPYDDLVVSNPDYDRTSGDSTLNNTGAVAVVFGSVTGNTVSIADIEAKTTTRGTLYLGDAAEDNFGAKITMIKTDQNSSQKSIAVSAPFHDSISKTNNGSVYVIKPENISREDYTMAELIARNSQRVYELRGEDDNELLGSDLSSVSHAYTGEDRSSLSMTSESGLYLVDGNLFENPIYTYEIGDSDNSQPVGHFSGSWAVDGGYGAKNNMLWELVRSITMKGINLSPSSYGRSTNCPTNKFSTLSPALLTARNNSSSNSSTIFRQVAVVQSDSIVLPYYQDCNHSYKTTLSSDQPLTHANFDSVGDINQDGNADFVVTLPSDVDSPLVASGRAYVIFGGLTFNSFNLSTLAAGDGTKGFVIDGSAAGELLGTSISEGLNFNGDANNSFALGAPAANEGNGRIYLIHGSEAFGKVIP